MAKEAADPVPKEPHEKGRPREVGGRPGIEEIPSAAQLAVEPHQPPSAGRRLSSAGSQNSGSVQRDLFRPSKPHLSRNQAIGDRRKDCKVGLQDGGPEISGRVEGAL